MFRFILLTSLALAATPPAFAEVRQSSADGAIIEHRFQIPATPKDAWGALVHPERWWPADHTWSGDPSYMQLNDQAGGCFCERWGENSAEHGRVIMAPQTVSSWQTREPQGRTACTTRESQRHWQ